MKQNLLLVLLLISVNCLAVVDTIPPVITLNGQNPFNHILNSTYVDAGATAFDNVDGNVTSSITTNISASNPNKDLAGNYTITYSVTDQSGNTGTATRTVHVYNQADFLVDSNYNGMDSCQSTGVNIFNGSISTSSTVNWEISINNFGAFGQMVNITGMATGSSVGSSITFTSNQSLGGSAFVINANGTINSLSPVTFTVAYLWSDGILNEQCASVYQLNSSVSVREIVSERNVKIFPNPSDGIVNLESMAGDIGEVCVYDMRGILVHRQKINGMEGEIDLSDMAAGIYFLKMRIDEGEQIYRIVRR